VVDRGKSDEDGKQVSAGVARLRQVLRDRVLPLVAADHGELYLVSASAEEVSLHLAGSCAGCPGATLTERHLLEPAVRDALPKARLVVTTGYRIPKDAERIIEGGEA
jgi:Fe-S cluster biogenesis protein NfuA